MLLIQTVAILPDIFGLEKGGGSGVVEQVDNLSHDRKWLQVASAMAEKSRSTAADESVRPTHGTDHF